MVPGKRWAVKLLGLAHYVTQSATQSQLLLPPSHFKVKHKLLWLQTYPWGLMDPPHPHPHTVIGTSATPTTPQLAGDINSEPGHLLGNLASPTPRHAGIDYSTRHQCFLFLPLPKVSSHLTSFLACFPLYTIL